MPLALLAALFSSLAIHAAALLLPDVDLAPAPEPPTVTAELQPPPRPPAPSEAPARKPNPPPAARHPAGHHKPAKAAVGTPAQPAAPVAAPGAVASGEPEAGTAPAAEAPAAPEKEAEEKPQVAPAEPAAPAGSALASRGYIRFQVYRGGKGLMVGRSEHRWEFEEGHYHLFSVTETSGLAALLKPVRIELESSGSLTASGLQPDRFTTRRNGSETKENADFDWDAHQVVLGRDGSRREIAEGTQDLLSFHYQLGYLAGVRQGVTMAVATGKKFERYRFDAVGIENIQTPAGYFETLHLRVQTDSTTELWLAVDRQLLPVKIRFTDKKGESFEQIATELGM